ncbi:MAG: Hpt domain-containing protein [Planctomycetota bacterium]|jgi:HPt (histidine-containing phosphotransfer) domain-containing protein
MDETNTGEGIEISIQKVIEQTGLDLDDYLEIYGLFQDNFEELIRELKAGLAMKDTDKIMRSAHTLKGSTSNIGFTEMAKLARRMQEHPADLELVAATIPQLELMYEQMNEQMKSLAGAVT